MEDTKGTVKYSKASNGSYESVKYRESSHLWLYIDAAEQNYAPHWHNEIEIIHVRKGTLRVSCQGIYYDLSQGDTLFIGPAVVHEIYNESPGNRFYIQADMSGFPALHELNTIFSLMSPAALITPSGFPVIFDRITDRIQEIQQIYFDTTTADQNINYPQEEADRMNHRIAATRLPFTAEMQIYTLLLGCIGLIGKEIQRRGQDDTPVNPQSLVGRNQQAMQEACSYIALHFSEPLSLEMVAKQVGFSKYYFERLFRQFTNMSFYQYVTKVRLSYAQQLLADRDVPITDVALRCGFSGASPFTRAFRQATGFTPSAFRQINEDRSSF